MKILGDFFRNAFVFESYALAIMYGAVAGGNKDYVHPMHVYGAGAVICGIFWFITRLLYRRGYRVSVKFTWTRGAA